MNRRTSPDFQRVREEIAIAAARMIAGDGLDYATARRKAARQALGDARIDSAWLPDNDQIEDEIRAWQALFQSESQPAVLRRLRAIALDWMRRLAAFQPYLSGAVLNGTASEHSDVHLQTFCDNPKDVAIYLLNANVRYDVSQSRHFASRGDVETLSFLWRAPQASSVSPASHGEASETPKAPGAPEAPVGIHIALYETDDLRGAVRADARGRLPRINARALQALLDEDRNSSKSGESGDGGENAENHAGHTRHANREDGKSSTSRASHKDHRSDAGGESHAGRKTGPNAPGPASHVHESEGSADETRAASFPIQPTTHED